MCQNEYVWSKGLSHIYFVICKCFDLRFCCLVNKSSAKSKVENGGVAFVKGANKRMSSLKQEGHDGPVSLHWLIREIHSYQTLHYLGIGLKHKTPYKD